MQPRSFSVLADEYVNFTNDMELVTHLTPSIEAACRFVLDRCDADPRGLLTYSIGHGGRLRNQGWKDSSDCICFPDGRLAAGPIALVEVQGYAVDGLERAARLLVARWQNGARRSRCSSARRLLREAIDTLCISTNRARALLRSTAMVCRS